jgi:hypothetical protein
MSNYVTTNIRLPEEDYLRLKNEAAKKRKSLASVIREKIGVRNQAAKSPSLIMKKIRAHAIGSSENLKDINILTELRQMRNKRKW